ncbi:MAG TPA: PaaI family thioesterase [Myxococcota bacterium]|nr:PaaI family thioesterase [Myxococcota bacterium]HRY94974.1 PaaI family thioesterase [Myxococcota bacterium]HSA20965.1 PaaI family thioesterase [Myxococcota bacterium]
MTFARLPVQPDHPCIACGHANPHGLRMEFETDGQVLRSRTQVPGHLCGWRGVAHGGVVSILLDEVMANAAIALLERLAVTRELQVTFVRPVRTGAPLEARARILSRPRPDRAELDAELRDAEGRLCAKARGSFALLGPADFRRLGFEQEVIADTERHLVACRAARLRAGQELAPEPDPE